MKQRKRVDRSGKQTLLALAKIGATSDDPYVSENIDHYLYGAPKKKRLKKRSRAFRELAKLPPTFTHIPDGAEYIHEQRREEDKLNSA